MTVPSRLAVAEAAGSDSILAKVTSVPWWSAAAVVALAVLSWPSAAGAARGATSIAQRDRFPAAGTLTYEFLSVPLVRP